MKCDYYSHIDLQRDFISKVVNLSGKYAWAPRNSLKRDRRKAAIP